MSSIPEVMRAVVLTGHGGYDKLEIRSDVAVRAPDAGEVIIEVGAAAVNNTDINTRVGWYTAAATGDGDTGWNGEALAFPRIQGIDGCGRIVGVGAGVDPARVGERVIIEPALREPLGWAPYAALYLGSEWDGSFAQYVTVPSAHAYRVESSLTDVELATFPCSYSTAENLLGRSKLAPNETVLVTGASGGVGSAAVQLAKRRRARVIAVAAAGKATALRALGADEVIGRNESVAEVLGSESVDVVIDVVGGDAWPELLTVLRRGGRYAVSGAIGGAIVPLDLRVLYLKDLAMFGGTIADGEVFANLVGYIERGEIAPAVAAVYPMTEIVAAQERFGAKDFVGKIVLTPL